jgi:hypothetical protein
MRLAMSARGIDPSQSTMPTDAAQSGPAVREALRRYLRAHPDAADTLVGIVQWWLPPALRQTPLPSVRRALAELMAAHEVRCSILPDGTELFSRAADGDPKTNDDR